MKKTILLFIFFSTAAGLISAQEPVPKTALVLIDIQEFYFDTAGAPLVGRFEATGKARAILEAFREGGDEVVHVMHNGGGEIHDLGYKTILIHDACATRDLKFGDEVIKARDVHLSTLSTLRAYADILSADEFLSR